MSYALAITSVGMVSSIGLSAPASCAAVRGGLTRFGDTPFHDREGNAVVAATAEEAGEGRQGPARLAHMSARAIRECLEGECGLSGAERPALLLVIGRLDRPDYPADMAERLWKKLDAELGTNLHPESGLITHGATGVFHALVEADRILRARLAPLCIVAAVDSLVNLAAFEWLQSARRLKTVENSDGIIPGEAAAAIAVRELGNKPCLMMVEGLGFAEEARPIAVGEPNLGLGLAQAISAALVSADTSLERVSFRVSGMTGERHGFIEAAMALSRIQTAHRDQFPLWSPAEQLGDVGAALGACMLVVTATAFSKQYAPGQTALISQSSPDTRRAAAIVRAGW